ncbi:acetylornithine deacetylase [Burkholderia sp. PAMC 28687]|uniref:acetylornithine deacetylase n=1 Tax=Burkholderia sp. PAMC 28687 TaxID=1795874 RepID=UPI0007847D31|nr:acetylornithine deacetylase [Burkholderia sp. PAMC 28687]AMM16659.1 acetylornithine deacetylase [Burkholderia sp. PAMC 28687]
MKHALLDTTLDLLNDLVAFDTRSSESNLKLIEYVQRYLNRHGVESSLVFDETGRKANLYATIGPKDVAGLCFSGHTDVVPAAGQPWTVPPFEMTRGSDRVFGRGTADMKGFIAAVLASVPHFVATCKDVPVHLAFSYDEEVGCRGVRGLLRELAAAPVKPLACIIGEPTSMQVAVAHKGKKAYRCCVKGLAGHSALTHLGVNAVDFAAELVTFLRRTQRDLRTKATLDHDFDPPYTTIHTGRFNGGIALNVIPDHAQVEFEIRNLPADNADAIVQTIAHYAETELVGAMRETFAESDIDWEQLVDYPALSDRAAAAWLRDLACAAAGRDDVRTLAFGTEGGLFQSIGIPTVVCGPGSIEQGHKADEYVELEQLSKCLTFLGNLSTSLPGTVSANR